MSTECVRCRLHATRTNVVWGEGAIPAKLMLIGEAPGSMEDMKGRPFVGAAGRILDEALEAAGLEREEIYITNVVKCRPPRNRRPSRREREACQIHLIREVQQVRPQLVGLLGLTAIRAFRKAATVKSVRRQLQPGVIGGRRLSTVGCYHPASPLHRPSMKELFFEDIQYLAEVLNYE